MKPTHRLKGMNKNNDKQQACLGAGWLNPDGSVSIVLDQFIVLEQRDGWIFTLFPVKDNK